MFGYLKFYIQIQLTLMLRRFYLVVHKFKQDIHGENDPINMEALGFQQVGSYTDTFLNNEYPCRLYQFTDGEQTWSVKLMERNGDYGVEADFGSRAGTDFSIENLQSRLVKQLMYLEFPPLCPNSRYNKVKNLIK